MTHRDKLSAQEDESAIRQTSARLLAAVNDSDVDGVLAVWSTGGILMPPHHAAVEGQAAIRSYFAELFSSRKLSFAFTSSVVEVHDNIALERLTFRATSTTISTGATGIDEGKGLHVYRREANAEWRLQLDIWNSDLRYDLVARS